MTSSGRAFACSSLFKLGATIGLSFITSGFSSGLEAKIPGAKHCYNSICHRVMTLPETQQVIGKRTIAKTSFYDDCSVDRFNTCALTSSGEVFKPHRPDNAASPIYPDGTKLLLWNPNTRVAAVVRVNSAGPYHSNRTLDVSRATAEKLGFKRAGVATLHIQVIEAPTPAESKYRKRREYTPVPGPIGVFASFETAASDMLKLFPRAVSKVLTASAPQQPSTVQPVPAPPLRVAAAKPMLSGLSMSRAPMSSARLTGSKVAMASIGDRRSSLPSKSMLGASFKSKTAKLNGASAADAPSASAPGIAKVTLRRGPGSKS